MLKVLHDSLNPNEIFIIEYMLKSCGVPALFVDISELTNKEPGSYLLVYNKTKGISSFQKKLKDIDFKLESTDKSLRIDKPGTFMKTKELRDQAYLDLKAFLEAEGILSDSITRSTKISDKQYIHITDINGNILEIRSDGVIPTIPNSITHSEFNTINELKEIFDFHKIHIA